jgi:hypothetical protein
MNSRRFMCASLGEITPYHTIAREQVLCITAKLIVEWQTWVQTRSFGDVGSMSGLPESSRAADTGGRLESAWRSLPRSLNGEVSATPWL